jgi:hypothetical protein
MKNSKKGGRMKKVAKSRIFKSYGGKTFKKRKKIDFQLKAFSTVRGEEAVDNAVDNVYVVEKSLENQGFGFPLFHFFHQCARGKDFCVQDIQMPLNKGK